MRYALRDWRKKSRNLKENKRVEKINKMKRFNLEKMNKIDKPLARLTKNKEGKITKNEIFSLVGTIL